MSSNWKWKSGLAALSIVLGIWFVLPTIFSGSGSQESGEPLWYEKFLPDSAIQLGLDLRGGIYMSLGVDLDRALLNESDRYVNDLKEFLQDRDIPFSKIERQYSSTKIHVHLETEDDMDAFESLLSNEFNILTIVSADSSTLSYELNLDPNRQSEIERDTITQALETLRNRLDEFGVAEPSIQAKGKDQIIVQLPGLSDPSKAKEILARTAQLEFKIVDRESLSPAELSELIEEAEKTLVEDYSVEQLNAALYGKIPSGTEVMFEELADSSTQDLIDKVPYLLVNDTRISGDLLDDARVGVGQYNEPVVNIRFNPKGTKEFDVLTKEHVGDLLAIVLDDKIFSAPRIDGHIPSGRSVITFGGAKTRQEIMEEAKSLAMVLRAGALPAPIEILENRTVGPSLGRDSIEKGMKAILLGVLLIVIFMAAYYRWSGLLADFAVLMNLVFILACLGSLHATLTLPGIAGILVSIGMAVDANVIIFERIREELRSGKPVRTSVELGYERAHLTILDSNLTTVITGLVLFQFGTGPIKGFAITLIFGLIANYFTALWFTRLVYDWYLQKYELKRLSV
ncbi:MAG: protein translocase subunit SecD [Bdellovibrionales bacterium]|nr:protein translocase subunit SecD [Bdellovibrionales bacterium]